MRLLIVLLLLMSLGCASPNYDHLQSTYVPRTDWSAENQRVQEAQTRLWLLMAEQEERRQAERDRRLAEMIAEEMRKDEE